ncbi:MAG: DUF3365 domain-containing protein [Magnetococcales bacterium]|nr:DUF3365 domain-containing protein [Magnetococcales bacterium]
MKNRIALALAAALFSAVPALAADAPAPAAAPSPAAAAPPVDPRVAASRAVVQEMGEQLKGELIGALEAGGPAKAIPVCQQKAQVIAGEISQKKGWKVARVSLKPRNPANTPDAWEKQVLEQFDARVAGGDGADSMEATSETVQDGKKVFRYMKAIRTAVKPCLACHGESIAPEIDAALKELYPADQARGYKAGMVRGAFSVTQPLP